MRKPKARGTVQQFRALSLTVAISMPLLAPFTVLAQDADDSEFIEEVVVHGIRQSLDTAALIKRNSDTIVDAITAEDIGLFSDNNIGEALQRIPGVQLERSEGEGFRISIRGLGPRFVRTTLNGRTALSSPGGEGGTDGRGFSFNVIPSEVISKATVHKSSQAIDVEGGIGGYVNLETTRPLDLAIDRDQDFYVTGSLRSVYNDLESQSSGRGSILLNKKVNDSFGVFLAATVDQSNRVQDSHESQDLSVEGFELLEGTILNGQALTEDLDIDAAVFDGVRNIRNIRDRDRETFTGGLQWQPSDNLEIYVDWTHGEMQEEREQLRSWLRVEDALDRLDRGDTPTQITNITINTDDANDDSYGTVTAFDFLNFTEDRGRTQADIASLLLDTDETIDVGGLNVKWSNDDWTVAADFGYASQELEFLQRRMFANLDYSTFIDPARFPLEGGVPDDEAGVNGSFNLTSDGPIVQYFDPMGVPFDVTDATDLNFHRDRQTFRIEDNSETSFRLDFTKELQDRDDGDLASFFDRINFGVNFRDRDGFRTEKRVDGSAGDRDDRGDFSDIAITQFGTQMVTGFMGDTSFIVPDIQAWIAADPAGTFALDASQGTVQDIEYSIAEDITSAYLQGSFSGGDRYPYRGNIGVRYADTEQTSTGFLSVSDNEIVTTDRTYDDVLPSANIAFDLTDSVVFRLAASRTITRPDPFDLRQGWDLEEVDGTDNEGSSGNPDLEPYRTDNYDMSLEWYPDRGGSYAIGVFHKKLDGYIADGVEFVDIDLSVFDPVLGITEFEIDRPVNTDGGTITGVELALHTPFDTFTDGFMSNFGITASVTYVDAELDAIREDTDFFVELRGTSEWSGNIVGYYENGPFGARLAYNVRNDFLHQEAISSVKFDEFTKGTEYVTLNLDYRFNDNWRLRFTADNLTDSQRFRQFGTAGRRYFGDQRDDGRSFVLELRGNM